MAELARYKHIEEAAQVVTEAVNVSYCERDDDKYRVFCGLRDALAATPESARAEAQRQREYVKALEAVVEAARPVLGNGRFKHSEYAHNAARALSQALSNLQAVMGKAKQ